MLNYMVSDIETHPLCDRAYFDSLSLLCHQLYLRGNAKDYDSWEEMGNPGELTI